MFAVPPPFLSTTVIVASNPLVRLVANPSGGTLSADLLSFTGTSSYPPAQEAMASKAALTGKRYFEVKVLVYPTELDFGYAFGVAEVSGAIVSEGATYLHRKAAFLTGGYNDFYNDATKAVAGFFNPVGGGLNVVGAIIGIIVDMPAGLMAFYTNGVFNRNAPGNLTSGSYYTPLFQMAAHIPVSLRFNGGDEAFQFMPVVAGLIPWNQGL